MRYISPKIVAVVNATATIHASMENSIFSDGAPHLTNVPAYQSDE